MGGYDSWHVHGGDGSTWIGALLLITLVLVGLLVLLGVLGRSARTPEDTAERILDQRFARGEIDEREYRARRTALHG
jgi:putative membrane protein